MKHLKCKVKIRSRRKIVLSLLLFLIPGLTLLQAQTMFLKQKSGVQSDYIIDDVRKLSFDSGNLIISAKNGEMYDVAISQVHYLSFTDFTTGVPLISERETDNLKLWPNPASDVLNVAFEYPEAEKTQLTVLNLQGQLTVQKVIDCHPGKNSIDVNLKHLPSGVYILQMQLQHSSFSTQFIKK